MPRTTNPARLPASRCSTSGASSLGTSSTSLTRATDAGHAGSWASRPARARGVLAGARRLLEPGGLRLGALEGPARDAVGLLGPGQRPARLLDGRAARRLVGARRLQRRPRLVEALLGAVRLAQGTLRRLLELVEAFGEQLVLHAGALGPVARLREGHRGRVALALQGAQGALRSVERILCGAPRRPRGADALVGRVAARAELALGRAVLRPLAGRLVELVGGVLRARLGALERTPHLGEARPQVARALAEQALARREAVDGRSGSASGARKDPRPAGRAPRAWPGAARAPPGARQARAPRPRARRRPPSRCPRAPPSAPGASSGRRRRASSAARARVPRSRCGAARGRPAARAGAAAGRSPSGRRGRGAGGCPWTTACARRARGGACASRCPRPPQPARGAPRGGS